MKIFLFFSLVFINSLASASDKDQVNQVLDQLHQSASKADGNQYFSLFSNQAIFIGTDPKETWTIQEFKNFALPYFNKGTGWTYISRDRHIYFSETKQTAWFDEMLDNEKYGETRGTGVLVSTKKGWKIAQYHLTLPIPNDLTKKIVKLIRNKAD